MDAPRLPFDRPAPLAPPSEYGRLRTADPVARVVTADGLPAWLVTRHDDVAAVLADPRFGVAPAGIPDNGSVFTDGPAHQRLRRLVGRVFTARRVADLRPGVERLAAAYVDRMAASGPPADLVASLAEPLPLAVIGDLLGVEVADRDRFRAWAAGVFAAMASGRAAEAAGDPMGYPAALVEAKRAAAGDDLLSALIAVHDAEDGRLSDTELVTMVLTLLLAGYLTTAHALTIGVLHLLGEAGPPGGPAGLADAPERRAAAVEEILRRQSGRNGEAMPRFAHADVDLRGRTIAAGDMVLPRIEAAHHDPDRFADAGRFDPGRQPNPHLAFGHGPHRCLGAALARLELDAALAALAARLPGLRLAQSADEVTWSGLVPDEGPVALAVTW